MKASPEQMAKVANWLAKHDLRCFLPKVFQTLNPSEEFSHNWHIEYLAWTLSRTLPVKVAPDAPMLNPTPNNPIRRLIINVPPRSLKPVWDESIVEVKGGKRVLLKDIKVGDKVLTHRGVYRKVEAVHIQGDLETLRIVTHSGREVLAAPDHPFLTPHGWVQAEHLTVGSVLALIPENHDTLSPPNKKDEEFRMAGYFIGDGNVTNGVKLKDGKHGLAANVTCYDDSQGEDIIHCAKTLGWECVVYSHRPDGKKTRYNLKGGVRDWLRATDIAGRNSHTKKVPDFVFEGNHRQIGHFIGAYFACDGTVSSKNRHNTTLLFSSVSKELLEGVQALLLRLGIFSRLRKRINNSLSNTYQPLGYVHYSLEIGNCNDVDRFYSKVFIPGVKAERIRVKGLRRTDFDRKILPDTIVAIEPAGKKPCRCLSVEKDKSFTVSGIAVHNSILCSVAYPAFLLGHYPHSRIIGASFASSLSKKMTSDTRTVVLSPWYRQMFPGTSILKDTESEFTTTQRGLRLSTSVGASIIGRGGNYLIADDLLNPKAAASDIERVQANEWFDQSLFTRLDDKNNGVVIVIMQRLHEDDLTGYLLRKNENLPPDRQWHWICLPAEAQTDQSLTFYNKTYHFNTGDLLHPDRESIDTLGEVRENLGSYAYAAQYLQQPAPKGGGLIQLDWFRRFNQHEFKPESARRIIQSWDTAIKISNHNDFSVGQTWAETDNGYYLLDQTRLRFEYHKLKPLVEEYAARWKPSAILIEDKGSGQQLIQDLRANTRLPVIAIIPEKDKAMRLSAVSPMVEAGKVNLPERASWLSQFELELLQFPNGRFDDSVDAFSQFLNWTRRYGPQTYRIRSL